MKKENQIVGNEVSVKEQNQIILYQPNDTIKLEVRLEDETVWLTANQMSVLFNRDEKTIRKHINNVFYEDEVSQINNTHFLRVDGVKQPVAFYTLDVVISVGYRVKSKQGVIFRQWANKVLKQYLLNGFAINQRVNQLEDKIDKKFAEQDAKIEHLNKQVDFFVRTSLPPVEGVFHNGQIFDAYKFVTDLIKSAKKSLVLIDNYVDESVLLMLSKRNQGVTAKIYTSQITHQLRLDLQRHHTQYPTIQLVRHTTSHDRFLIIDDTEVYHIGASLKDLGKKLFAFSKLNIEPSAII